MRAISKMLAISNQSSRDYIYSRSALRRGKLTFSNKRIITQKGK